MRCWGDGSWNQLGYGDSEHIGDDETPASTGNVVVGGPVRQIAMGSTHSCALMESGGVRCWGSGQTGALGYENLDIVGDDETPASAGDVSLGEGAKQLDAGAGITCALLESGSVRCWGGGAAGALGLGTTNDVGDDEVPSAVPTVNVGGPASQLAVGVGHACALLTTGNVRCWGSNSSGQLGYGNTNNIGDNETPASAGSVIQLSAGGFHTCALLDTGSVRCWGLNNSGQLGYGNTNDIGDNETPATAGDVNVGYSTTEF